MTDGIGTHTRFSSVTPNFAYLLTDLIKEDLPTLLQRKK